MTKSRSSGMPVIFGPPECVVITDRSPVAAGGIITFHPFSIAVRLKEYDRLCDSQDRLNPVLFPIPFGIGTLGLATRSLRSVPCIPLSGLSSRQQLRSCGRARIRIPMCPIIISKIVLIVKSCKYTYY